MLIPPWRTFDEAVADLAPRPRTERLALLARYGLLYSGLAAAVLR